MRNLIFTLALFAFTATFSQETKQKIADFPATVVAIDSTANVATIGAGGHFWQIQARGLQGHDPLILNWEYEFIIDISALDCNSCVVRPGGAVIAYHISTRQAAKNIARMKRLNIPPTK